MKKNRSLNTLINIIFGLINKVANIIIPFIIRTIVIYVLGVKYIGLNTLFSSVLQVLNLAELGISSAVVYCMYKPMADENTNEICALLQLMRKIYRIIGTIVGIIGILIIPFLKYLIKDGYPDDVNLILLYLIFLINTIIGYFFYAYKATLLNAGQKNGILSNVNTLIMFVQGIIQIIILVVFKNYYVFIIVMPICTLFNNIGIAIVTQKIYPNYVCNGQISRDVVNTIIKRVKGLFITRLCTTTRNAFDSIFISSFIGLTAVAIYGNYYYIMAAIISILNIVTTSMTASVGNSMVTESVEKNYVDMIKFNFSFNWIVGFCTVCLLCLFQPFMKIWVGKDMSYSMDMVILFCIYFYVLNIGSIRAVYHDAAGLWWEARYRAIFEAVLNLILNAILTMWLGVFGTILGTLISLFFVNYIYGTQIVFKYYFKGCSIKQYYLENFSYGITTLILGGIVYYLSDLIVLEGILGLFFKLIVCMVVFNLLYYIIHRNNPLFEMNKKLGKNILRRF